MANPAENARRPQLPTLTTVGVTVCAIVAIAAAALAIVALVATFLPQSSIGFLAVGPQYVLPGVSGGVALLAVLAAFVIYKCGRSKADRTLLSNRVDPHQQQASVGPTTQEVEQLREELRLEKEKNAQLEEEAQSRNEQLTQLTQKIKDLVPTAPLVNGLPPHQQGGNYGAPPNTASSTLATNTGNITVKINHDNV